MDRSTLQKLILAKLPLPADFCEAIKDFFPLNPPTPTAALISQLVFQRIIRGMSFQRMIVEGCDIRVRGGGLGFRYQGPEPEQFFFYDPSTGEPIPNLCHTPTPWLQRYQDWLQSFQDLMALWDSDSEDGDEEVWDEESRERLREIWD